MPIARPASNFSHVVERAPRIGGVDALVALLLAITVALSHGWSLTDGTVLDDWWHQKALRENGWSYSELMRSLEIEPAKFIETWWQNETMRWEYGRPLFILAMKLVYHVIGGDNPTALHAFSITLHYISALLIWRIALRLCAARFWSFVAAYLFAVYPHALITVAWPSSQNVVIQNTLMLAAMLCYLRGVDLDIRAKAKPASQTASPIKSGYLIATFALWIAALFTRENALMLPVILLALEFVFRGWAGAWSRRNLFVAFAVIGAAFMIWRILNVTTPMPDVYVRRPAGDLPEYNLWLVAKIMHYLCASVWLAPMVVGPTGRLNPFTEAPFDCAVMAAILIVMFGGYWLVARHARGWWIWPLWILLAILPVAPVIATPHSGYMSGVAFALGAALAATAGRARWQRCLGGGAAIFFVVAMSLMTMLNRWQWTAIIAAERYLPSRVAYSPPSRLVRDVFFINMPFVNVYVKPNLVSRLGPWFQDVTCHVLTYSPDPILFEQRCWLTQVDDHSFRVRVEGQPYFSRLLGRFLIEGFRNDTRLPFNQPIKGTACEARILDHDTDGVRELLFTFERPLTDPSYCFYLTSKDCGGLRLRFRNMSENANGATTQSAEKSAAAKPTAVSLQDVRLALGMLNEGDAEAAKTLFGAIEAGPAAPDSAALAASELQPIALAVSTALGAPTQDMLAQETLTAEQWRIVRDWWNASVSSSEVDQAWVSWPQFAHFVKEREEAPHARMWAAKAIHTDLYLTGPPFPGPR